MRKRTKERIKRTWKAVKHDMSELGKIIGTNAPKVHAATSRMAHSIGSHMIGPPSKKRRRVEVELY
jgi:hypothetical protein